ncbi:MAG: TIM-barrel domain-containing protein, partial [Ignavibacteriaceae bacterium]
MKKYLLFFLIYFLSTIVIWADFKFVGNIASSQRFDDRIEFRLDSSKFNLYVIDENIIRFRFSKNEFSKAPSYAVIYQTVPVSFDFKEYENNYEVLTKELIVRISKSPCRVSIYDKNQILINEDEKSFGVSYDDDEVRCFKKLFDDENFYGLGEKTGSLNKRGNQWTMWNSDIPGYNFDTDPIYQSVPFFIGIKEKKAYGIFLDNTYKSYFNMGAANKRFYWFGAEKGELDYYFIYGPEIKKVITSYTQLTGRMEMPPMWALGYQQSRWSYFPEESVRNIAEQFRS